MKTMKTGSDAAVVSHEHHASLDAAATKTKARHSGPALDQIETKNAPHGRGRKVDHHEQNVGRALSDLKQLLEAAKNSPAREILDNAAYAARLEQSGSLLTVRLDSRAQPPKSEASGIIERMERVDHESGKSRTVVVFRPNKKGLRAVELADSSALDGIPNGAPVVMKPSGKVVATLDISRTLMLANMIGVVKKEGDKLVLVARNTLSPIQRLSLEDTDVSLVGKTVMVDVFSPMSSSRHGVVRDVMDATDPLKVRYAELAVESGIQATFPKDVLAQVEEIKRTATFEPKAGVVDLRDKVFLATDNPALETDGVSKDRDQAFHVEERPGGGHVYYYAIADKRHLIARDSPLDRYAAEKMLTMYLPGFDFPVLPRELSEDLLSLNANVPRAAVVHQIAVDAAGNVIEGESTYYRAIIKNTWDGCYKDQQAYYDGKPVPFLSTEQKAQLDLVKALWQDLEKAALERGQVKDRTTGQLPAQDVTEKLSITANAVLGATLAAAGVPGLNRHHAIPKQEKLNAFADVSRALADATGRPELAWHFKDQNLGAYLNALDTKDSCAPGLGFLAMRTNERATVSVAERGHYGLGLKEYAWSTAPMRRAVDMSNLEQVVAVVARRSNPSVEIPYTEEELAKLAERHNIVEDTMRYVERKVANVQDAAALAPFVGKTISATVLGVAPGGITFVSDDPKVRVFVPARALTDALGERVELSKSAIEMVSMSGGARYRIGDAGIPLKINSVDVEAGEVSALPTAAS